MTSAKIRAALRECLKTIACILASVEEDEPSPRKPARAKASPEPKAPTPAAAPPPPAPPIPTAPPAPKPAPVPKPLAPPMAPRAQAAGVTTPAKSSPVNLVDARKALDISQEELARRVGCSLASLIKWETSNTLPAWDEQRQRLLEELGVA